MNEIKHIFFDLDHTLWDFEKNSTLTFQKIFKELAFDISIEKFISVYNPINVAYWKLFERNEIDHETLRVNRLKDAFDAIDFYITIDEINQISDLFIKYLTDNNYLFDGAIDILEYLYPKYKLHIITNGLLYVQEMKLQKSSLDKYFQTVTNSEMAGYKKPHHNIYLHAINLANAKRENSIMIGDSFEADILGAINFGMKAVYFNSKKEEVEVHNIIQIQQLIDLKNVL